MTPATGCLPIAGNECYYYDIKTGKQKLVQDCI